VLLLGVKVKVAVATEPDGLLQILLLFTVKALVGVGLTVTSTVVTVGETHPGEPGFATCSVRVLTEGVAVLLIQLTVQGPCVFPGAVIQASQFHVKVALERVVAGLTGAKVKTVDAADVDGFPHILVLEAVKLLSGVGFTVTRTVVTAAEVQAGAGATASFQVCKVMVLTDGLLVALVQLTTCGPSVLGNGVELQPSQFQL